MTFGQNLKRLRLAAGLKQIDLARALGYRQQTSISVWERTATIPTTKVIERLAAALSCTPAALLDNVVTAPDRMRGGVTPPPVGAEVLTDDEREVLHLYRQIRQETRRPVRRILRALAHDYPHGPIR